MRCALCSTAAPSEPSVDHRRVRRRDLCWCGCAAIGRRAAIRCASMPPRARSCSPCRRAAACKRGARLRAEARRLDRGAARPAAAAGAVRAWRDGAAARRRRIASSIGRGARGTVWVEIGDDGERAALRRRRGAACRAPRRAIFSSARPSAISKPRAAAPPQQLGVAIKRVSIRDQSSRWGSCSTTGVLSYSWRLILAPPFVLDYLAAHEVAHLVEMNHSRAFWRLVERICPDVARAKAWLDAHGADLHRYGAAHGTRRAGARMPRHLRTSNPHAASRHFRAHRAARGADRGRAADDRHVSAVAAGHRAAARRLDARRCSSRSRPI